MNNLKFALRQLMKNPGFTTVAVLTLALLKAANGAAVDAGVAPKTPKTRFSIQHQDGTAWLVRPNGERFFSLGVCCVNQGASRTEFDSANPGYAAWQYYADSNAWA